MSEHTTNLNLTLPDYSEDADIGVLNDNFNAIDTAIAGKASTSSLATVATSGAYSDLTGTPTIDSELDNASTNAVQNAAVTAGISSAGKAPLRRGTALSATSSSHFSLHTLCTDTEHYGVGRYYVGSSIMSYIDDKPTGFGAGCEITVEENQLTNRFIITITANQSSWAGTVFKQWLTSDGWSAWYKFEGTAVT